MALSATFQQSRKFVGGKCRRGSCVKYFDRALAVGSLRGGEWMDRLYEHQTEGRKIRKSLGLPLGN